jgi:hypothetical protein
VRPLPIPISCRSHAEHIHTSMGMVGRRNEVKFPRWFIALVPVAMLGACVGLQPPSPHSDAFQGSYYRHQFDEWVPLAEQGFAPAQYQVGTYYQVGAGVPKDLSEAAKWYQRAAEQGHVRAQYSLALLYGAGLGVPRDYEQAYFWYSLAAANLPPGNDRNNALEMMTLLERYMGRPQVLTAQEKVRQWAPKKAATAGERTSSEALGRGQQGRQTLEAITMGSGFVVNREGYVITSNHVVEGCSKVHVSGARVRLVARDASNDLALLKYAQSSVTAATFRGGRSIRPGDQAVVVGFPLAGLLSSRATVTTGNVAALVGPRNDARLIQITAPVQVGNSGGPVLDESGHVIGVVASKLDWIALLAVTGDIPQNVNFAVNGRMVQSFLDANGVNYNVSESRLTLSPADIGDKSKEFTVAIECEP